MPELAKAPTEMDLLKDLVDPAVSTTLSSGNEADLFSLFSYHHHHHHGLVSSERPMDLRNSRTASGSRNGKDIPTRTATNPYGDGAPHGDPFQSWSNPAGADDAYRGNSQRSLGLGPPPRSASLDFPGGPYYHHQGHFQPSYAQEASVATPTPANRYAQRPMYRTSSIPEERSQMEELLGMMRTILLNQEELKASVSGLDMSVSGLDNRVSAMEARLANPEHPTLSRDLAARRGGRFAQAKSHSTRRSTRSIPLDPALSTDDSIDGDDTDLVPYTEDDSASESVQLNEINLSKTERRLLKEYTTGVFYRVCNVFDKVWPEPDSVRQNPITKEIYPTPDFAQKVDAQQNKAIFRKVAMLADAELKDKRRWPLGLERKDTAEQPTWDPAYLFEVAKDVFRTAKRPWRASRTPEGRAKAAAGNTADRRMQRLKLKSKQMEKVIEEYGAANNLTVDFLRDLIHPEFLSDEVSGPEEGAEESKDAWKVRMAVAANMSTDPAVLKRREFLEVLSPEWRTSEVYSDIVHSIHKLSINRGHAPNLQYDRVSVGRASERIPRYAPFNFGISKAWVDVNKKDPERSLRLLDWGKFPEPEDCGLVFGEQDAHELQEN
ncbi:hypothetical protein K438DRAFT_1982627 [Mycena galopus ATCC 62051]|nr:hypothetical protein K438DRAFT_1982627 [Mycena galopus ATCC 62051]